MESFVFTANPKVPATQIRDLAVLGWLSAGESVILFGPVESAKPSELSIEHGDIQVDMLPMGGFFDTALESVLRNLRADTRQIRATEAKQISNCLASSRADQWSRPTTAGPARSPPRPRHRR